MAETLYRYLVTDTLYDSLAADRLAADITDHPWITGQLVSVVLNGQNIDITFAAALTAIEESRVRGMVCGHDGVAVKMIMSRGVVGLEHSLTPGWDVVDGFAIDLPSITATVGRLVLRLSGEWKAGSAGAQLQVTEAAGASDQDKFAAPIDVPDTGGTWTAFQVESDVALLEGAGPNVYRLLEQRGGATAPSIRYCELALLWV